MPATEAERLSRQQRWHQSSLSDIEGCPRLYGLTHVLGLPTGPRLNALGGTVYHKVVETDQQARLDGTDRLTEEQAIEVGHTYLDALLGEVPVDMLEVYQTDKSSRSKNRLLGRDALRAEVEQATRAYYTAKTRLTEDDTERNGPTIREYLDSKPVVTLETFLHAQYVPDAKEIGGTFDGLYDELIDHKSAVSFGNVYSFDGSYLRAQATMYSVLCVLSEDVPHITELPPVSFLVVLRKQGLRPTTEAARIITVQPTLFDAQQLRARIIKAEGIVADGRYPRNPAYIHCVRCPFWDRCEGDPEGALRQPFAQLTQTLADE